MYLEAKTSVAMEGGFISKTSPPITIFIFSSSNVSATFFSIGYVVTCPISKSGFPTPGFKSVNSTS